MDYITILGLVAGAITTISLVPQIMHTWKTKKTSDISLVMYSIFTLGIILWLAYGLMRNDLAIIAANAVTITLAFVMLYFKLKYK